MFIVPSDDDPANLDWVLEKLSTAVARFSETTEPEQGSPA